jgi:ribonucleoside-diphosphate reductase subunit M2
MLNSDELLTWVSCKLFREAVEIEKNLYIESLPCNLMGMNSVLMSQYIEYVADKMVKRC